ncbi:MAG: pantothenate kinase [Bacilli bacterium]|nr:pantothenate kinase [Bacilli bacterium]
MGNTNLKYGIFEGQQFHFLGRTATNRNQTTDDIRNSLTGFFQHRGYSLRSIEGVAISSVVPSLTPVLEVVCRNLFHCNPLLVGPGIRTGLKINYDQPAQLGSDRLTDAVAAVHLYGPPLIIVALGTATTLCVVDELGQYQGGLIVPGIQISTEALSQQTAQLPRIQLTKPNRIIGKNTAENIQAGAIFGGAGQVDGIVGRIFAEFPLRFTVVATGGLSELIAPLCTTIQYTNPRLLFEGLRVLWELNQ